MSDDLDINAIELDADDGDSVSILKENVLRRKGRGFDSHKREHEKVNDYETVGPDDNDDLSGPQKSVEGWILFVTSVHEEASEEDLSDKFSEFGTIRNISINLDRRTGFLKGYALIEYGEFAEANAARLALDGTEILGQLVGVDWCFVKTGRRFTRSKNRFN